MAFTSTSKSRSPSTPNMTLAIRTRNSVATDTPAVGKFISTQADRCPFPGCQNESPHNHSTAEGNIAPSIDEYRKAGEAIRERWTEEQRRRIAENEALLRQLAEIEPKVSSLSIKTHLPRGNDLTVQEQIDIIHSGVSPIPQVSNRASSSASQTEDESQTQAAQTARAEWDDFPELDGQYNTGSNLVKSRNQLPTSKGLISNTTRNLSPYYQNADFLNTNSPLCTGPCPILTPHNRGPYLQQGQVPRAWNARWGYSDPPREIWEAWVRIEQGRGSSWDKVQVDGFALSHRWGGQ